MVANEEQQPPINAFGIAVSPGIHGQYEVQSIAILDAAPYFLLSQKCTTLSRLSSLDNPRNHAHLILAGK